jgi:hypothetical protein
MKITGFLGTARGKWIRRVALVTGFAVVRLLYARAGVRFRAEPIDFFAQYLDPPLLRDRLLESLWVLHAQPPLFNLGVGLALKVSPENPGAPLHGLFLAAGLAGCLALGRILRLLGLHPWLASGLALVVTATPPFLLYENHCFYPHLAGVLLVLAGAGFLSSGGRPGGAMAGAFWVLGALAMMRSLFHPLYLVIAAAVAAKVAPTGGRRRVLASAAPPTVLVLLLAAKNLALFGFFGTSSWGGNSLHRMMTETLDGRVVEEMIAAGTLSPISREWEFERPEVYVGILAPGAPDRGVPALDETGKTRAPENPVNYNHWIYPIASREFFRDALQMIRAHPGAYLESVRWTSRRFLEPVVDDVFLGPNRLRIKPGVRASESIERSTVYRLVLAAALLWAGVAALRRSTPRSERLFLAFAVGTVLWVAVFGIGFEYGENNRFRFQLLGLLAALVAYGARDLLRAGRRVLRNA